MLLEIRNEFSQNQQAASIEQTKRSMQRRSSSCQAASPTNPTSISSSDSETTQKRFSSLLQPSGSRVVIIVRDTRSLCQVRDFLACPAYYQGNRSVMHAQCASGGSVESGATVDPNEGNLHADIRQFVTQQATAIRQELITGGAQRGGNRAKGRGYTPSTSVTRDSGIDTSGDIQVGCAVNRPITEKAFESLRVDQKMMLVLEKNLQNGTIGIEVLGTDSPTSSDSGKGKATESGVTQKRSLSESMVPNGSKQKRRRTTKDDSIEEEKSVGDDGNAEPVVTVLDEVLHVYVLTHEMCHSSYHPFEDIRPSRVIFLDADVKTIRLVETYHASSWSDVKVDIL